VHHAGKLWVAMLQSWAWWYCSSGMHHGCQLSSQPTAASIRELGSEPKEGGQRTAFHGGVTFCMTTSCGGGSLRVWESHACHSAGTCEALYSCYEKKKSRFRALSVRLECTIVTNLRKIDPTMTACQTGQRNRAWRELRAVPGTSCSALRFSK
jgi:hypothetical protein